MCVYAIYFWSSLDFFVFIFFLEIFTIKWQVLYIIRIGMKMGFFWRKNFFGQFLCAGTGLEKVLKIAQKHFVINLTEKKIDRIFYKLSQMMPLGLKLVGNCSIAREKLFFMKIFGQNGKILWCYFQKLHCIRFFPIFLF